MSREHGGCRIRISALMLLKKKKSWYKEYWKGSKAPQGFLGCGLFSKMACCSCRPLFHFRIVLLTCISIFKRTMGNSEKTDPGPNPLWWTFKCFYLKILCSRTGWVTRNCKAVSFTVQPYTLTSHHSRSHALMWAFPPHHLQPPLAVMISWLSPL